MPVLKAKGSSTPYHARIQARPTCVSKRADVSRALLVAWRSRANRPGLLINWFNMAAYSARFGATASRWRQRACLTIAAARSLYPIPLSPGADTLQIDKHGKGNEQELEASYPSAGGCPRGTAKGQLVISCSRAAWLPWALRPARPARLYQHHYRK